MKKKNKKLCPECGRKVKIDTGWGYYCVPVQIKNSIFDALDEAKLHAKGDLRLKTRNYPNGKP